MKDVDDIVLNNIKVFSNKDTVKIYSTKRRLFPQEEKIVNKYLNKRSGVVLELGCGTGRVTTVLRQLGYPVVGLDISKSMIYEAKRIDSSIDYVIGDAMNLAFKDNTFDYVIFSFNGIDYIYPESQRIRVIQEVYRILKRGGLFIFSTHNTWYLLSKNLGGYYYIFKFWITNIKRVFSNYKLSECQYGKLFTYHINPISQKKQLEDNGFSLLDIVGMWDDGRKYFEPWLYYVAQKG